jgi:hypothetical protein
MRPNVSVATINVTVEVMERVEKALAHGTFHCN